MLKIIAFIMFLVWGMLVFLGKSGFVHVLLLTSIGVASVELLYAYRVRVTSPD